MEKPRTRSPVLIYGVPVIAGLAAFALVSSAGTSLWSVFAAAALLTFGVAAMQWLDHDPRRSPAQEAWRTFPEPQEFRSREEAADYAARAAEASVASGQERRLNRIGVWLVVLAAALMLRAIGVLD